MLPGHPLADKVADAEIRTARRRHDAEGPQARTTPFLPKVPWRRGGTPAWRMQQPAGDSQAELSGLTPAQRQQVLYRTPSHHPRGCAAASPTRARAEPCDGQGGSQHQHQGHHELRPGALIPRGRVREVFTRRSASSPIATPCASCCALN